MKSTPEQQCMLSVLHSQCCACWCTGDFRSQCISRHGIDSTKPENFVSSIKRLTNCYHFVEIKLIIIWYIFIFIGKEHDLGEQWCVLHWDRNVNHFDEIFITGCTGICHFDNFRCNQWRKFHQNDISVLVNFTLADHERSGYSSPNVTICMVAKHGA